MLERNYENLTSYIKSVIRYQQDYLKYTDLFQDMIAFVIRTVPVLDTDRKYSYLSYEDSMKLVEEFFGEVSPELLDNYQNILSFSDKVTFISVRGENEKIEQVIKGIEHRHEEGRMSDEKYEKILHYHNMRMLDGDDSGVSDEGDVNIYLKGNIEDAFAMLHEMMHVIFFQNVSYEDRTLNHEFLVEVNSITAEFLFADYLANKGILKEEAQRYILNRFLFTLDNAYLSSFHYMLMDIVKECGYVDEGLIDVYIDRCSDLEKKEFQESKEKLLNHIFSNGFVFITSNRYIMALFMACYLKEEMVATGDVSKLFQVGKGIYEDDLHQTLNSASLDFFDVYTFRKLFRKKEKAMEVNELYEEMKQSFIEEWSKLEGRAR